MEYFIISKHFYDLSFTASVKKCHLQVTKTHFHDFSVINKITLTVKYCITKYLWCSTRKINESSKFAWNIKYDRKLKFCGNKIFLQNTSTWSFIEKRGFTSYTPKHKTTDGNGPTLGVIPSYLIAPKPLAFTKPDCFVAPIQTAPVK